MFLSAVLIHLGGFNLSLVMRQWLGKGTPRGWQGYSAEAVLAGLRLWMAVLAQTEESVTLPTLQTPEYPAPVTILLLPVAE
jgi:hypothetical protein